MRAMLHLIGNVLNANFMLPRQNLELMFSGLI